MNLSFLPSPTTNLSTILPVDSMRNFLLALAVLLLISSGKTEADGSSSKLFMPKLFA